MRTVLFSALLGFIFLSGSLKAQDCTPDPNITAPGFYPAQLDTIIPDVDYSQTLQIRVLSDTTVIIFGSPQKAYIDSVVLRAIVGLPSGFTYKCYNSNCRYVPDTTGCAILSGKAAAGDAGVYPLKLAVDIFGRLGSGFKAVQPDTIRSLTLVVKGNSATIADLNIQKIQLYPNPSADGMVHVFVNTNLLPAVFSCYSMDGKLVKEQVLDANNNAIDLSQNPTGCFYGRVNSMSGRELWKGKISLLKL